MKRILLIATMAFAAVSAFAQPKFAHVNSQELWQLAPEADQARATMEASSKEAQETYQAFMEEFQNKYQQYEQKASTWTPAIRETKEKELTDIQKRIQQFEQTVQEELRQQEQSLYAPIIQKVNDTIKKLAEEGGYVYVFDIQSILYIDDKQSTDLTPAARTILGIPEGRTLETLQAELQAKAQAQAAEE